MRRQPAKQDKPVKIESTPVVKTDEEILFGPGDDSVISKKEAQDFIVHKNKEYKRSQLLTDAQRAEFDKLFNGLKTLFLVKLKMEAKTQQSKLKFEAK